MPNKVTGLRILVAVLDERGQPVARLFARMHGMDAQDTRYQEPRRCHDAPRLHVQCRRHADIQNGQTLVFGPNRFTIVSGGGGAALEVYADDRTPAGEMVLICRRQPTGGGDADVS